MLNKIIIMGRLTRDPEIRYTKSEKAVVNFSLAVDREYSKDNKETDFFDIVAWEKRAEFVSKYFAKGQLVCIEGRMQRRSWVDNDKKTRYTYEIIAESVYFADSKKNNGHESASDGVAPYVEETIDFDPFNDEAA